MKTDFSSRLLVWAGAACLLFFVYLFSVEIIPNGWFLIPDDEVSFYNAARSWIERGNATAVGCVFESLSKVGNFNWYGPGYSAFYGGIAHFFGLSQKLFPAVHFFLGWCSLVLIFVFVKEKTFRNFLLFSLLCYPSFSRFVFTALPESFHIFSGVILWLLLRKLFAIHASPDFLKFASIFGAAVLLFSFFRPTTIFWAMGVFFLPNSKKRIWILAFVFFAMLAVILLYMRLFMAPSFLGGFGAIYSLLNGDLIGFVNGLYVNIYKNFVILLSEMNPAVFIHFFVLTAGVVFATQSRNRFLIACAGISIIITLILIFFYRTYAIFFTRQVGFLVVPIMALLFTGYNQNRFRAAISFFLVFLAPFSMVSAFKMVKAHQESYHSLQRNIELYRAFNGISKELKGSNPTVVLWNDMAFGEGGKPLAVLPILTAEGSDVIYSTNLGSPLADPRKMFRLHGKLHPSYYLSRKPLAKEFLEERLLELCTSNPFFYFYKVSNNP